MDIDIYIVHMYTYRYKDTYRGFGPGGAAAGARGGAG